MDLKRHIHICELLDVYEKLLTPGQAKIMRFYYHENFSLGEIADLENISRTAIHDRIRQATAKLETYEEKLGLIAKNERQRAQLEKLVSLCEDSTVSALLEQLLKEV